MANASHITAAAGSGVRIPDETEAGLIETNRLNHVANVNTAVQVVDGGWHSAEIPCDNGRHTQGGGTVTATYPYFSGLGER